MKIRSRTNAGLTTFHLCTDFLMRKRVIDVQPIKKPVRTLSIFKSMTFVKDAKGISFKIRLKGHIN